MSDIATAGSFAQQQTQADPTASPTTTTSIEDVAINTIRTLCIDAVQAANSGHPGTPMAMAPVVYELWNHVLRFDPQRPIWSNRDRFVLSAGHASTLLYSLLHLTGVTAVNSAYEAVGQPAVSLDDIKKFRQLDSRCPGHPEYRWTSGVECTTGPLGTGLATSVGMAIAGKWQAATFNRPGFDLFDYNVYALGGDGCFMEGISQEAASLAGHLQLDNLCWIYDNNHITIEGSTELAFTDDVATRFIGYGWNVTRVGDANDRQMLARAFEVFRRESSRPTLIIVDSHIGYGAATKMGTAAAHGEPLGVDEVRSAKRFYGWPEDAQFLVPDGVYEHFAAGIGARGHELRSAWDQQFDKYRAEYPELGEHLDLMQRRQLPEGWDADIPDFPADEKGKATRESNGVVLNAIAPRVPWLIGGAADLSPSTKTSLTFEGAGSFEPDNYAGRNLHYGVREHASAAVANGLSLSKIRPYQSGFLIFSDFERGALRLSSIMEIPVIYIFTHDSIGVGEDGPTHQPVEHIASLRAMPGIIDMRPGDANEVAEAWRVVMPLRHDPVVFFLSRQALPTLDRTKYAPASGLAQGGYILADPPEGEPQVILIATGSEVALAVGAYEQLTADGVRARVVSLPSWELFDRQDQAYRESVLPPAITARVAIEQASGFGWERYVGSTGGIVAMSTFGASAPLKALQSKFGFTPDAVVRVARQQVERNGG